MLLIIGFVVVLVCVIGGYALAGGHLEVLWQPYEFMIIFGAAIGAYVIGNPSTVLKKTGGAVASAIKGPRYNKAAFLELLSLLYSVFKLAKTKGMLALEQHVENPHDSSLFNQFPIFAKDHHAVTFLCDYLRLMTLGTENSYEMEALIDIELETHAQEEHEVSHAIQNMADGMPALGIVAAVLGVIHTMGAITEPPEVLGHLIGGALVGTFVGVWTSYGFIAPISNAIRSTHDSEMRYLHCIKSGLLAHLQGYPPAVSVEFARKALQTHVRPTFYEVEEATQKLQPV